MIGRAVPIVQRLKPTWSCASGDAAALLIRAFRDEIEDRIKAKRTGRIGAMAAE